MGIAFNLYSNLGKIACFQPTNTACLPVLQVLDSSHQSCVALSFRTWPRFIRFTLIPFQEAVRSIVFFIAISLCSPEMPLIFMLICVLDLAKLTYSVSFCCVFSQLSSALTLSHHFQVRGKLGPHVALWTLRGGGRAPHRWVGCEFTLPSSLWEAPLDAGGGGLLHSLTEQREGS